MPPKQSKADVAKKQKVVEDKTSGLKNKNKSKTVQKYVQNLKQSMQPKIDPKKTDAKKKKEEALAREKELNELFKVAISQPKVPPGVDPKSIVCEFFKAGQCAKGFKCKFSHDLNVQRKGEKIDVFSDKRDADTMEEWDQETLEKAIEAKSKEYNQNRPTEIASHHYAMTHTDDNVQLTPRSIGLGSAGTSPSSSSTAAPTTTMEPPIPPVMSIPPEMQTLIDFILQQQQRMEQQFGDVQQQVGDVQQRQVRMEGLIDDIRQTQQHLQTEQTTLRDIQALITQRLERSAQLMANTSSQQVQTCQILQMLLDRMGTGASPPQPPQ